MWLCSDNSRGMNGHVGVHAGEEDGGCGGGLQAGAVECGGRLQRQGPADKWQGANMCLDPWGDGEVDRDGFGMRMVASCCGKEAAHGHTSNHCLCFFLPSASAGPGVPQLCAPAFFLQGLLQTVLELKPAQGSCSLSSHTGS